MQVCEPSEISHQRHLFIANEFSLTLKCILSPTILVATKILHYFQHSFLYHTHMTPPIDQ